MSYAWVMWTELDVPTVKRPFYIPVVEDGSPRARRNFFSLNFDSSSLISKCWDEVLLIDACGKKEKLFWQSNSGSSLRRLSYYSFVSGAEKLLMTKSESYITLSTKRVHLTETLEYCHKESLVCIFSCPGMHITLQVSLDHGCWFMPCLRVWKRTESITEKKRKLLLARKDGEERPTRLVVILLWRATSLCFERERLTQR